MGKTTKRVLDSDRFKSRDLGFTGAKTELDSDGNNRPFTLPRLEVFLNADALPGPEKRALMVRGYLGYEQAKGSSTFAWNVCAGVFLAMLLPMPVVSGIRQCTDHMDDCYNQKYKQKLVRESEREDIEINSPNAERMSHSRFSPLHRTDIDSRRCLFDRHFYAETERGSSTNVECDIC